ncbi:MAG: FAD-dependent 5-carboxymethylaminomethyl-2-thiouridine(34) oxidoreductase MnmC [Pseudomonadota bacterium]
MPSPDIHFSVDGDPVSDAFEDGYYSSEDGLEESRHVFLKGNDLERRFSHLKNEAFTIGELGFGTGLNFLLARELFLEAAPPSARLHFWSVEGFPLDHDDLAKALDRWKSKLSGIDALVAAYPPTVPGIHRLSFDSGRAMLDLVFADASVALADLASQPVKGVDAWFLDGFAPSRNPQMWASAVFTNMAASCFEGSTYATYTAAGDVRRGLAAAGFSVAEREGYGRKRESIYGEFVGSRERHEGTSPSLTASSAILPSASSPSSSSLQTPAPGAPPAPASSEEPQPAPTKSTSTSTASSSSSPSPSPSESTQAKEASRSLRPALTPWDLPDTQLSPPHRVIVLGAGLGGAHCASALARRGIRSQVLDPGPVAGRGSGNTQGVLFTRLSHQRSSLADFSLSAFLYARSLYQELFHDRRLKPEHGALSGCLQLEPPRGNAAKVAESLQDLASLAIPMAGAEAHRHLGIDASGDGFWQPGSGWLSPPAVCAALLDHNMIEVRSDLGSLTLSCAAEHQSNHWRVSGEDGELFKSSHVIIAAGVASADLVEGGWLPTKSVRGQTTEIPTPPGEPLAASLCHRGYIAPARQGFHCIGATFSPNDSSTELRNSDHEENLRTLAEAVPDWREYLESLDPTALEGRAELRCVSPDYLPLAGPVPDVSTFRDDFAALGFDAKQVVEHKGNYQPGLYLSTGHGSRGLSYAALCAELIASQILNEIPPVSRELQRAVAPARFLIRDIIRGENNQDA